MSVQIDLIPHSCRVALGRRARIRRWVGLYALGIAAVVGACISTATTEARHARERDALQRQVQRKWEQNEEAQRIWKQIQELEATIARYERLAWPVRVTDVIAAIGEQLPESLALTSLTLTPRQESTAGARGKARDKEKKPEPPRTIMAIEIEGMAPTDLALSQFVSGIEEHPMFRSVVLDFARSRQVDGIDARGFRVTCEVDLSARYTFVDAAGAEVTP